MNVKLLAKTTGLDEYENRSIDEIILGIARVSSNRKDLFANPEKLLRHFALEQHWSVFESCYLTFEIITSRAITHEIIRHKSMSFQEFSLRYSKAVDIEDIELRQQCENNRQSSSDLINPIIDNRLSSDIVEDLMIQALGDYNLLIGAGVAKEVARFVLPLATQTKINVTGNIRSWLTFLNSRLHKTAQKEIRIVAESIAEELKKQCPIICGCFFNFEDAYHVHFLERLVLEKYDCYKAVKQRMVQDS
ncbi:MAG TPA: FAD-dependent thymidylate synthase [Allocoleopsis sp.]